MCKCLPKKTVLSLGLILTIFFGHLHRHLRSWLSADWYEMDGCRSMETFSRHSSRCCCCCFCHLSFRVDHFNLRCSMQNDSNDFCSFWISYDDICTGCCNLRIGCRAIGKDEYTKMCYKNYTGIFEDFKVLDELMKSKRFRRL